jgi:hypothetical protein
MDYILERNQITFPPHVQLHEGDEYVVCRKQEGYALVLKQKERNLKQYIGMGEVHIKDARAMVEEVNRSRDEWDDV